VSVLKNVFRKSIVIKNFLLLSHLFILSLFSFASEAQRCSQTIQIGVQTSNCHSDSRSVAAPSVASTSISNSNARRVSVRPKLTNSGSDKNTDSQAETGAHSAVTQYSGVADLVGFQNSIQVGDIGTRLASMRPGMEQNIRDVGQDSSLEHPDQGLLARYSNSSKTTGSAAGDYDNSNYCGRFGMFMNVAAGRGKKKTNSVSHGFGYRNNNLSVGLDYVLTPSVIVGLAVGIGETKSTLDQESGELKIETNTVSVYMSKYFLGGWFFDAAMCLGKMNASNNRAIDFTMGDEVIWQTAVSEFDSEQNLVSISLGKRFDTYFDIELTGRLSYVATTVDRFDEAIDDEKFGLGMAIEIDKQKASSVSSDVGLRMSRSFSTNWGVVTPELSLRWQHEFNQGDPRSLTGRFLSNPDQFNLDGSNMIRDNYDKMRFSVPLEQPDGDYGAVKFGVSAHLANGFTANASASKTIGLKDFDHTYYSLILRKDF